MTYRAVSFSSTEAPETFGTGYDTYEASPRVIGSGWQVNRIGQNSDAFEGFYPTKAAAIKQAKKLAGV